MIFFRRILIYGASLAILLSSAYGEFRKIDLHDYDDDLMRDLDRTIKYFEPDITAGNAEGALGDAEVLQDGFRYTENYFAKKGDTDDAVKISQKGLELIETAIKSVSENNFEAAAEAARETVKICKSCHELYKPPSKN
ncbi:MAG TPA: hypothetical protein VEK34_00080 [Methylocella sp.]|nr:hypothetical protein [Methylocella sp.]